STRAAPPPRRRPRARATAATPTAATTAAAIASSCDAGPGSTLLSARQRVELFHDGDHGIHVAHARLGGGEGNDDVALVDHGTELRERGILLEVGDFRG